MEMQRGEEELHQVPRMVKRDEEQQVRLGTGRQDEEPLAVFHRHLDRFVPQWHIQMWEEGTVEQSW